MTIKQLRVQITALQAATMDENKNFRSAYDEGKFDALSAIDTLLDSLQEEPVSEDLEEAAINATDEDMQGRQIMEESNENRQLYSRIFRRGFKAGAEWQKQQDQSTIELAEDHAMLAGMEKMKEEMMAKAIDVEVKVDAGGYPYIDKTIELYDYDKDVPLAKEGDKYKVVLIKEDGL